MTVKCRAIGEGGAVVRKSIATVSLSGTLEEKLSVAAQVGFDGVELFESDLISCALTPAQIRQRAADLGLRLELYQPLRDIECVRDELFAANLRRAESKFEIMSQLGIDTVLLCSTVSAMAVDDDVLAAQQLRQLADLAAPYGIRVAYEALAWGRYVYDYHHTWKIVAAADHSYLGICLDSFHVLSREDDLSAIGDIPGSKIFYVQLADAPCMRLDVRQWSRHHRCFPGQGNFDLPSFLSRVLAAGYDGPLSLEVFNDVLRQADAGRTATDALRSLIALEESIGGRHLPALGNDGQAELIVRDPCTPPAAVPLTGYSFVELTIDPTVESGAEHLLRGMGFAHVGRHRSKPVQLWQQGQARVLLNRTLPASSGWPRGEAAISAIAVESDNPARSCRRAQMLLAPRVPRRYGPGEADLFATEAPDGTSLFFCRTDMSPESWLADFERCGDDADPSSTGGLFDIDHVGLSQPGLSFDEAALFYQSVLGLRCTHSGEISDPYGLVRSRAVANDSGQVRLVLNTPALAIGTLPETAGFQHVAFSTMDVFTIAVRMRADNLPMLRIPGNYYQDLAGRTSLDRSLIEAMRELSILYDCDGQGGEFFHFYTATLGRRLFFEIVQRLNQYDGYAMANAPVRMAAQYRQSLLAPVPAFT